MVEKLLKQIEDKLLELQRFKFVSGQVETISYLKMLNSSIDLKWTPSITEKDLGSDRDLFLLISNIRNLIIKTKEHKKYKTRLSRLFRVFISSMKKEKISKLSKIDTKKIKRIYSSEIDIDVARSVRNRYNIEDEEDETEDWNIYY